MADQFKLRLRILRVVGTLSAVFLLYVYVLGLNRGWADSACLEYGLPYAYTGLDLAVFCVDPGGAIYQLTEKGLVRKEDKKKARD